MTGNTTIITIGRQYGAGGRSVAAAIGKILSIPVYDNDLLCEAAKEYGYSRSLFKRRDEKRHLLSLAGLFSSYDSNTDNYMGDGALFQMQCETIRHLAEKGSCVIVGRCADYILRDHPGKTSVFLTSPLNVRVERVMDRLSVDERTAEKIISKKEKNRINFYNGFTLKKWGDAASYDLCLDTSKIGIEGAARTIIDFVRASQSTQ